MVPLYHMFCMYVYGLQQYGQLNDSSPLCFLFCSVLYFKEKIGEIDVAVCN